MRIKVLLLLCLTISLKLTAQEKIYIHKSDKNTLGAPVSLTDSVYFSDNGTTVNFRVGTAFKTFQVTEIDSILFGDNSNTVQITYNGSSASVVNPMAFEGVSVEIIGAGVVVNSTLEDQEISYELSGTSPDGMFKIYSNTKFNLVLNEVSLNNADGPAINIQTGKKCTLNLMTGTSNLLTDGNTYSASDEDQKATLFSEGKLEFAGNGSLTVKSNSKHAICSDDFVSVLEGTIVVSGSAKDGIHANDSFKMSGGSLNVTATGDGIDCEGGYIEISGGSITTNNTAANVKGISCDSTLLISGGNIKITLSGNQSKGLKSGQKLTLSGGTVNITNSGAVVLETALSGFDPSYSCGIKCDSEVEISSTYLTIKCTGAGGKGIAADGNIRIISGTIDIATSGNGATYKNSTAVTDSYSAACLSTNVNVDITGGLLTLSASGTGGKGIKAAGTITVGDETNSPTLKITTSGAKFLVSGKDYCHPKAIVSDTKVIVNNGNVSISSSDDGIHAENSYTQNGGSVTISNSYEGVEGFNVIMNSGILTISATNDGINATAGTVRGGTESNDGSSLTVNGGTLVVSASNGDAIDSNGNIIINSGTTVANGPNSGVEEACDFNGSFTMKGGTFIGAGSNSNMTKAMSSSSTQPNMYISSGSAVSSGTILHIQDSAGKDILSFKPKNGAYKFLFSSGGLSKGSSYSIYTGGSYSGGTSLEGLYSGGTYSSSGATLKKTASLSTSATVNNISF